MQSSDKETTVKRVGGLLLEGWKLLNMTCPICNNALMSKGNSCLCPHCNLPVVKESDAGNKLISDVPVTNVSPAVETEWMSDNKRKHESLEDAKKEYDKSRAHQNLVSSKIGEKLLLGWTLLSAECPQASCGGVPLMSKKGGPKYCVSCDSTYDTTNSAPKQVAAAKTTEAVQSVGSQKDTTAVDYSDMTSAPFLDDVGNIVPDGEPTECADTKLIEETSALIGSKLIIGWKLLDAVCEGACKGTVPLMVDPKRSGTRYCVRCGYEDDKAPSLMSPRVEASEAESVSDVEDTDDAVISAYNEKRRREVTAASVSADIHTPNDSLAGAVNCIHQKITWATQKLNATVNVQECTQYAQLIKSLAEALAALKSVS